MDKLDKSGFLEYLESKFLPAIRNKYKEKWIREALYDDITNAERPKWNIVSTDMPKHLHSRSTGLHAVTNLRKKVNSGLDLAKLSREIARDGGLEIIQDWLRVACKPDDLSDEIDVLIRNLMEKRLQNIALVFVDIRTTTFFSMSCEFEAHYLNAMVSEQILNIILLRT